MLIILLTAGAIILSLTCMAHAQVTYVTQFGTSGSGNGQLDNPMGMAVNTTGYVYVADADNHRVQVFDRNGNYLTQIGGTRGSGNGQLNWPQGVAVNATGYVYVADCFNDRVQVFDRNGNYLTKFGTTGTGNGQFASPFGVAVNATGYVYVVDCYNCRIQVFDLNGNYLTKFGTRGSGNGQLDAPKGVAINATGYVYVAGNINCWVNVYDQSGNYLTKFGTRGSGNGQFWSPYDVTVNATGCVYVTDFILNWVQVFDRNGNYLYRFGADGVGDGQFKWARGLAVNATGYVYVADSNNNRVQVFGELYPLAGFTADRLSGLAPLTVQFTDTSAGLSINRWEWQWGDGTPNGTTQNPSHTYTTAGVYTVTMTAYNPNGSSTCQQTRYIEVIARTLPTVSFSANKTANLTPACIQFTDASTGYGITGYQWDFGDAAFGTANSSAQNPVHTYNSAGVYTVTLTVSNGNGSTTRQLSGYIYVSMGQPNFAYAATFGTRGTGNGQFNGPWGVAVNATGYVYVADFINERIQVFDQNGNFLTQFGTPGAGNGQLFGPHGLAVNTTGYVYVTDMGNNRVVVFDQNGNYLYQFGTRGTGNGQFYAPRGVAINASGYVYVTDELNSIVQVFDQNGNYLYQFGTQGTGNGQFSNPMGVAVNATGYVYVTDYGNNRVQVFDQNGNYLYQFGTQGTGNGQFDHPEDVAVNATGYVYVADVFNSRVQVFDQNGNYLYQFGTSGSGNGQFNNPQGLAINATGYVYVTDYNNNRVQVFGYLLYPSAGFTADRSAGLMPLTVQFTDTSTGPNINRWEWQWGDGTPNGTIQNPSHTYTTAGVYTVNMTVYNPNSTCTMQHNAYITAVDGEAIYAYVPNSNDNTISVIDTGLNAAVFTLPVGSTPMSVAVNPARTKAYVTDFRSNTVSVIDTSTMAKVTTIPVGANPNGVAVNPAGTKAYVTCSGSNNVYVIDTATNTVIGTHISVGAFPYGIALNPSGTIAYVANAAGGTVSVIDLGTDTVTGTIPAGTSPYGVAVNLQNTTIYVTNGGGNTVQAIDTATNAVTPIMVGTQGNGPKGVAFNPAMARAYVANYGDNAVTVIDTATNTVMAIVPVGFHPWGVSVTPDGTRVYVTNGQGNTVSVIDTASNTVIATIPVGLGPVGMGQFIAKGSQRPVTAFSANKTTNLTPACIRFTDASTGAYAWQWDFGDKPFGTANSTTQSPVHTFITAGTYTVTLTTYNGNGSNTMQRTAYITVVDPTLPTASFSANKTNGLNPLCLLFTDASTGEGITRWQWDFGDATFGTANSTEQCPVHTYTTPGVYTVTLTTYNGNGSNTLQRAAYIENVARTLPTAGFTADVTKGLNPLAVQFTDQSTGLGITGYAWDFGDTTFGSANSTMQSPSHTYTAPGTYTVTLTTYNGNGSNTLQRTAYIESVARTLPTAGFSANRTDGLDPLCVRFTDASTGYGITGYQWDFGDATFGTANSTEQSPVHTYTTPGVYTVTLTTLNGNGSNTLQRTSYITDVARTLPVAGFSANVTAGLNRLCVQFTDASTGHGITGWQWDFGDATFGTANSTEQNPVHTYASPGNYTVTLTTSNGNGSSTLQRASYIAVILTTSESSSGASGFVVFGKTYDGAGPGLLDDVMVYLDGPDGTRQGMARSGAYRVNGTYMLGISDCSRGNYTLRVDYPGYSAPAKSFYYGGSYIIVTADFYLRQATAATPTPDATPTGPVKPTPTPTALPDTGVSVQPVPFPGWEVLIAIGIGILAVANRKKNN